MSTYIPAEHPRDNGGRWAEKPHADPGHNVLGGLDDDWGWEPADTYPYPQANDLDKVAIVADLVKRGVDTGDAIAHALDLSPREGRYYADAAAWMGFLERGGDEELDGGVYRVSRGAGEQFIELPNGERALVIAMIVDQIDDTRAPHEEVVRRLQKDGLSPTTAKRRADTMRSWRTQVDSRHLAGKISDTEDHLAGRFDLSFQMAREQRAEARAKRAAGAVMHGRQCPRCFQTMALTGVCDNCD